MRIAGLGMALVGLLALAPALAADWIRPSATRVNSAFILSREFVCAKPVAKATLRASAAGIGVWRLNNQVLGARLQPDVSYYEREIYYEELEVGRLLAATNCLAVEVGGGWFEQNLAWACENHGRGVSYGTPAAWGELTIVYQDGTRATIGTDTAWHAYASEIVWNNIYGGEIRDARVSAGSPAPVVKATDITGKLVKAKIPGAKTLATFHANSVKSAVGPRHDAWIYDFGTNLAGSVELNLPPLVPGSRLRVRLAETLTQEGVLDTRSEGSFATHHAPEYLFIAPAVPRPIKWLPSFSYTSFRYAEVSGYEPFPDQASNWGKAPPLALLESQMIATPFAEVGSFSCGNPALAQLIAVARHTVRCNAHGIPEDCPGREKGGWLGDAQLVAPWVLANYAADDFYLKFLDDMRLGLELYGSIPCQVPTTRAFSWEPAPPIWRAAAVTLPYHLWMGGGRGDAVSNHWQQVVKALEMFAAEAQDGIVSEGYGDWVPPPQGNASPTRMPVTHSSTLAWLECLTMAEAMSVQLDLPLNFDPKALIRKVQNRLVERFYDRQGHTYGFDGSDAAAWCLGAFPPGDGDALLAALLQRMERRDWQLTTGIFASPFLARALVRSGHGEVLMRTFFNPRQISYQSVLQEGFTTLPEDLSDKLRYPAGDGSPHSYSHPMHAGWLRTLAEDVAGIRPLAPGYQEFTVDPRPVPSIGDYQAVVPTPYGKITLAYKDGKYRLSVPAGTRAIVKAKAAALPGPCTIAWPEGLEQN